MNIFEQVLDQKNEVTLANVYAFGAYSDTKPALLCGDDVLSYRQYFEHTLKLASYLDRKLALPGCRVMLVIEDGFSFAISFFGTVTSGAIAVPVDPLIGELELHHMISVVEPTLILASPESMDKVIRVIAEQKSGTANFSPEVICMADSSGTRIGNAEIAKQEIDHALAHRPMNEIAYCLFSSGTTGKPKAIAHSFTDLMHCAEAYAADVMCLQESDIVMAIPKHTFGYALGGNLVFSLLYKSTSVLFPERSTSDRVLHNIEKYGVTILLAQPRIIAEILNREDNRAATRGNIRMLMSAGESLSESILARWTAVSDVPLVEGFGSTEVGHIFISNHAEDVRPGIVGKGLRGYELKLIDNDGDLIENDDIPGRLCIRCPSLFKKYWANPEKTAEAIREGWYISSDLFKRRDSGWVYVGRHDDMIKTGCGEWVSPYEIENLVLTSEAVLECAAVGFRNAAGVVVLKVIIVPTGESPDLEAIEAQVVADSAAKWPMHPHKHIKVVGFVDALPRGSTGKLQRSQLESVTLNEYSYDC